MEKVLKEKKEQIKKEFIEKIKGYTIDEYADFLFKPAEKKVNTLEGINYTTDYMNIEDFGNIKKDDNFMKKFAQMKIPKLMY